MLIHDWSRVDAGIFHHCHQSWIGSVAQTLNDGLLPRDYYALKQEFATGPGCNVAETDMAFYRRKQNVIAVRHVSDDRVVAVLEIISPGNKRAQRPFQAFLQKAADFIEAGVHLLIVDIHRPGKRDPQGIHAAIWNTFSEEEYSLLDETALTLAAYECGNTVRAYVLHPKIGDALPEMPMFLEPGQAVSVPLEATYQRAFEEVPRRWQRVLS